MSVVETLLVVADALWTSTEVVEAPAEVAALEDDDPGAPSAPEELTKAVGCC